MHFYMSYACKFGYHKQVKDKLDESFHQYLPNQEILRPQFENIPAKGNGEDAKQDESLSDGQQ